MRRTLAVSLGKVQNSTHAIQWKDVDARLVNPGDIQWSLRDMADDLRRANNDCVGGGHLVYQPAASYGKPAERIATLVIRGELCKLRDHEKNLRHNASIWQRPGMLKNLLNRSSVKE